MEYVEFIIPLPYPSKKDKTERAMVLQDRVGIVESLGSRPVKLLGVQQKRRVATRVVASKPKFVPADKPTAGPDSKSNENLQEIMEELNKQEKITFIFKRMNSGWSAKHGG